MSHDVSGGPSKALSARYPWILVGLLWCVCFFNYADRVAVGSVLPELGREFGFSKAEQGLIASAFMWVYAAASPFAGAVGDGWPRKWVVLGGLMVWSVITGFTAGCRQLWQFVLVRGSEGLGEAFYMPASMAYIADFHGPATRSKAVGIHQTSLYAGTIAGGALTGWLAMERGWRFPFVFLGVAGVVLGLVLVRFLREPARTGVDRATPRRMLSREVPRQLAWLGLLVAGVFVARAAMGSVPAGTAGLARIGAVVGAIAAMLAVVVGAGRLVPQLGDWLFARRESTGPWAVARELRGIPSATWIIVAFFGANIVNTVFLTWMPTYLKEKFGLNLAQAGLGATLFPYAASGLGALAGGWIADRRATRSASGRVRLKMTAVLCGAPFIVLCGWTRDLWVVAGAMTCFGFCKGLYDANLTPAFYDVVPAHRRSTSTGLMNLIGFVAGSIAPIAVGVAVDAGAGMGSAIMATAGAYVLVAFALAMASRTVAADMAKRDATGV
ncbi:MAG: MFS transporter [Armatimonadota bacterium]